MKLSVFSLKRILFQSEAKLLGCNTSMGEITVLENHHPLISTVKKGTVKVVDTSDTEDYFPVEGGFLKVGTHNDVTLIVDEIDM